MGITVKVRQIDLMDRGLDLELKGERLASRDELHEC